MIDELKMKLSTKFMRDVLAGLLQKMILKKTGYNVDIQIEEISIETVDGKIRLHANVDGEISNEEFMRIVKRLI